MDSAGQFLRAHLKTKEFYCLYLPPCPLPKGGEEELIRVLPA